MTAELVAQIAADPDDDSAYLVYADWLQAQGDPLGELIILEHRLANGEEVHRQRGAYLEKHRHYLLGAVSHRVDLYLSSPRNYGLLRRLPRDGQLGAWLAAPVSRFVTTVIAEGQAANDALEKTSPLALRALAVLRDSGENPPDLAWLWSRFPRLERFEVSGGNALLGDIAMPHAREIWLGDAGVFGNVDAAAAIGRASWPALESARIAIFGEGDELAPLFDGEHAPRLERLAINTLATPLDTLVRLLVESPLLPKLRHLELSSIEKLHGPAADTMADAIAGFEHLEVLDITLGKRIRRRDRKPLQRLVKLDPAGTRMKRQFADGF